MTDMENQFWLILYLIPTLVSSQSLVLIGGDLEADNAVIFQRVIELSGGPGAKIGLMLMASGDPEGDAITYTDRFSSYGANATWIPITITSDNFNDPAIADLISQQRGLYFSGGQPYRIMDTLRVDGKDTLAMTAVRQLLNNGGMLVGSGAGVLTQTTRLAILSLGRNATYPALTYQNYTIATEGGLGTLDVPYLLDVHCSEYGWEGRLIRILMDTRHLPLGSNQGICIDENHALVVTDLHEHPVGQVIGSSNSGLKIFDVTDAIANPSPWADFERISMSSLTVDDQIDLTTGEITIAPWKKPLAGQEVYENASPSSDIFSTGTTGQWRDTANRLVDNKVDQTVRSVSLEKDPTQYDVIFDRSLATAYGANLPGDNRTFVYSFLDVLVDIRGL